MSDVRDPSTDQVLPTGNDRTFIQDLVVADIEERKQHGIRKYGTALQSGNGRNMLLDAYEEALDLAIYLRGMLDEADHSIDVAHLQRQRAWSARTFGPGRRTGGVLAHIRKELQEIEDDPGNVTEWVDVVILALDGAWRAGWEPQQIIDALKVKQAVNEARTWPDWRTLGQDEPSEHIRPEAGQ